MSKSQEENFNPDQCSKDNYRDSNQTKQPILTILETIIPCDNSSHIVKGTYTSAIVQKERELIEKTKSVFTDFLCNFSSKPREMREAAYNEQKAIVQEKLTKIISELFDE